MLTGAVAADVPSATLAVTDAVTHFAPVAEVANATFCDAAPVYEVDPWIVATAADQFVLMLNVGI
jgi:hypothetical protein